MHVKDAVRMAKTYVTDLFADEQIMNVGLEEIEFDGMTNVWRITIGFSRPWDQKKNLTAALVEGHQRRSYKVLLLDNISGEVHSVTDRLLNAPS